MKGRRGEGRRKRGRMEWGGKEMEGGGGSKGMRGKMEGEREGGRMEE